MKIMISKYLELLYRNNLLDYEVSLDWILGYTQKKNTEQIKYCLYTFKDRTQQIKVNNRLINKIKEEFGYDDVEEIVNVLLFLAFILGGDE